MRRLRTITLWTGTLLRVLIAAAFVVSARWQVAAQAGKVCVYVMVGSILVLLDDPLTIPVVVDGHSFGLAHWTMWPADGQWFIEFPIYAPFAAVAIPTLLAWRFWPKPVKPGHCECGYDLTGNTSGVCPECGAEVQA